MTAYQRDFERRVRIGVVGAGSHAYRNIFPTLTFLPVELAAVCDIDTARAAVVAQQYGAAGVYGSLGEMLAAEQLDAVLLCVSPTVHPQLAIEAFAHGVDVWLEKPAATRVGEVEEMLAARGDRICVVGYKKAFMPATVKAGELLSLQPDDALRTVLAVYPMTIPPDGRAVLASGALTRWLLDGCHPLSLLLTLGGDVDTVAVHRGRRGGGVCVLTYASGAVGTLHLADGAPTSQPLERYAVYGDGYSITIDNASRVIYQRGIEFDYASTATFAPVGTDGGALVWEAQNAFNTLENKALFIQGIHNELRYFCDCVLTRTPAARGTLELARDVTRVYEAALVSDGDTVAVSDIGKGVTA